MSEAARNALNALLYNTGAASRDFMLVLATNRPTDLDRAVADRVDEHIQFDLPGTKERERLVRLYFDKYIGPGTPGLTPDSAIDEAVLSDLAVQLDGFSGRAISKLMISAQGAAYGSSDGILSLGALEEVVRTKIAQRARQAELRSGGEASDWS
jgi:ATPase family AAA domain-containing protein 3A/B